MKKIINKKTIEAVYDFIKDVYKNNDSDIIFSRQTEYSLNNFKDSNVLEVKDTYNSVYKNSNSYKWLEKNTRYKPIWSFIFSNEMNNSFDEFEDAFVFGGGKGDFVFVSKVPKGSLKTNFFNWVDIHYLLNDGTKEELKEEMYKINMDYLLNINGGDRIQILSESLEDNDVISILKLGE